MSRHWGKVGIQERKNWIWQSFSVGAVQLVGTRLCQSHWEVSPGTCLVFLGEQELAKQRQVFLWSPLSIFNTQKVASPLVHWRDVLASTLPQHWLIWGIKTSQWDEWTFICNDIRQQPSPFRVIQAVLPWATHRYICPVAIRLCTSVQLQYLSREVIGSACINCLSNKK